MGFEVVDFAANVLEIELLPWQQFLFIHGLELKVPLSMLVDPLNDYRYRFRTFLVLVSRQCGKTTGLMVLSLWRLVMDGARMVLGTSTNLDYAREAWQKAVELAWGPPGTKYFQGVSQLEGMFAPPRYANGEQTLSTLDGARYKIAVAGRTGGRSLSVDLGVIDELREHKTWDAWSAISKTTNARPRGQRWALSNMGDDTSVVLNHLRDQALMGVIEELVSAGLFAEALELIEEIGNKDLLKDLQTKLLAAEQGADFLVDSDPALGIAEWSAPKGCATGDRQHWPQAVPALGHTISEDTIASDQRSDPEEVFRTEVLCQRVPTLEPLPITVEMWQGARKRQQSPPSGAPVFGISVAPSQLSAAITAAAMASKDVAHLELADHRNGNDWVVPRMQELKKSHPQARFVMMSTGAAIALLPDMIKAGIEPELLNTIDLGKAYAHLQKRLVDRQVTHSGAAGFEWALLGAVKRDVGEGLWSLGWRKATSDLTPIESAAVGLWPLVSAFDTLPQIF